MNVNDTRDRIRGSLIGGAVGDALGYAVEFTGENAIFRRYGMPGITAYERSVDTGKALISDDTQMTLFTAEGLLVGEACRRIQPDAGTPHSFVAKAYQDWLLTQELGLEGIRERTDGKEGSRLMNVPELFYARAPGNTCLNALFAARRSGEFDLDYIEKPRNNSKGCGGVMRVAPAALYRKPGRRLRIAQLDEEAAQIAAITHGHPLGYILMNISRRYRASLVYVDDRALRQPASLRKPIACPSLGRKHISKLRLYIHSITTLL